MSAVSCSTVKQLIVSASDTQRLWKSCIAAKLLTEGQQVEY